MTDDLGLPDRRELPSEVLDNLRISLREGMGKPARRRGPIVAAAAAVVLVLAGALVATAVIREPDRQGPAVASDPDFALDLPKAIPAMDRCWAAIRAQDRTAGFPAREEWVPQFSVAHSWSSVTVVAVKAGDKVFFCETTEMTVTVSDPNVAPSYAAGTKAASLLMSRNGTVAGVADPGWPGMEIFSRAADSTVTSDVKVFRNGNLFVELSQFKPSRTTYSVGPYTGEPGDGVNVAPYGLPPAPEPAVTSIDRPPLSVPSRDTPAGEFFRTCVAGATETLPDEDGYQTGTLLEGDDVKVVVGRFGERSIVCQGGLGYRDGTSEYYRVFADTKTEPRPVSKLRAETLGGSEQGLPGRAKNAFIGTVPRTATTVKLDFGAGKKVDAAVTEGTFAVWLPDGIDTENPDAPVGVVVLDAAGVILHQGTLPLF